MAGLSFSGLPLEEPVSQKHAQTRALWGEGFDISLQAGKQD